MCVCVCVFSFVVAFFPCLSNVKSVFKIHDRLVQSDGDPLGWRAVCFAVVAGFCGFASAALPLPGREKNSERGSCGWCLLSFEVSVFYRVSGYGSGG